MTPPTLPATLMSNVLVLIMEIWWEWGRDSGRENGPWPLTLFGDKTGDRARPPSSGHLVISQTVLRVRCREMQKSEKGVKKQTEQIAGVSRCHGLGPKNGNGQRRWYKHLKRFCFLSSFKTWLRIPYKPFPIALSELCSGHIPTWKTPYIEFRLKVSVMCSKVVLWKVRIILNELVY